MLHKVLLGTPFVLAVLGYFLVCHAVLQEPLGPGYARINRYFKTGLGSCFVAAFVFLGFALVLAGDLASLKKMPGLLLLFDTACALALGIILMLLYGLWWIVSTPQRHRHERSGYYQLP